MISNESIAQKRADNADPYEHVVSVYANVVPLAIYPAPNLHLVRISAYKDGLVDLQ